MRMEIFIVCSLGWEFLPLEEGAAGISNGEKVWGDLRW